MFSPTDGMTRDERREYEREQNQIAFQERVASVLDRAPDLVFFRSRKETEALNVAFLTDLRRQMNWRHLTDLQVEVAVKAYQMHLGQKIEYEGTEPCPEGITFVQGHIRSLYRQHHMVLRHDEANRPKIRVLDDRGFVVVTTCPQHIIDEVGGLDNLVGWRIQFGIDLVPSEKDHTVGYKRPRREGGDGILDRPKLLGLQYEIV